jgi:chemotaxis response regulator CheB
MASTSGNIKLAWVVDSSEYYRRFEAECIAKATKGCNIELLDLKQAQAKLKKGCNPDVLVIDILQPSANGIEVVNGLKQEYPAMDIVVCSSEAKKNRNRLIGMTLINKPIISLPYFMDTMKNIIESA